MKTFSVASNELLPSITLERVGCLRSTRNDTPSMSHWTRLPAACVFVNPSVSSSGVSWGMSVLTNGTMFVSSKQPVGSVIPVELAELSGSVELP